MKLSALKATLRGHWKAFTLKKAIFSADKLEIGEKQKTHILMAL